MRLRTLLKILEDNYKFTLVGKHLSGDNEFTAFLFEFSGDLLCLSRTKLRNPTIHLTENYISLSNARQQVTIMELNNNIIYLLIIRYNYNTNCKILIYTNSKEDKDIFIKAEYYIENQELDEYKIIYNMNELSKLIQIIDLVDYKRLSIKGNIFGFDIEKSEFIDIEDKNTTFGY